ncbi:MAG TPA: hypothetical protein VK433_08585 [Stellaceae bacterium]|nr:hypothetical protein [Stellaceae bacterium]
MQIPPGQAALPPNPTPPVAPAAQVARAEVIEPVGRVTPGREGAEANGKSKPRSGLQDLPRGGPRTGSRGQLLDLFV